MPLLILLCPTILVLVLSIKLTFNSNTLAKKVLGGFFFLFLIVMISLSMVSHGTDLPGLAPLVNLFSLLFYVAILALPPTVYIYTLFLTKYGEKTDSKFPILPHYYISILLLLISMIAYTYFLITPEDQADKYTYTLIEHVMTYSSFIALIFIFPIANIYYSYKAFLNYLNHKKVISTYFSYEEGISLKWIKTFLIGYFLFIGFIYIVQLSTYGNLFVPTVILVTCYLGFVGYKGSQQVPIIINQVAENEALDAFKENSLTSSSKTDSEKENHQTGIPTDSKLITSLPYNEKKYQALKKALIDYMEQKKPYLNSKLNLSQLSKELNTNNKYLSVLLNHGFNQNFVNFINAYRIQEAKKLLVNPKYRIYTIESIANTAGFHSKSTFNNAFKHFTGMTPSVYKKTMLSSLVLE